MALPNPPNRNHREKSQNPGERLTLDAVALTRRTSMTLRDGLDIDEWQRVGQQIYRISDSSTWWLGDWLNYGRGRYPDRYRKAIEKAQLDYQTLRNYAWVARKFPPSRRRAQLSFQHHMEVASLPEHEQEMWLDKAESLGWSRNQLRNHVKEALRNATPATVMQVLLSIPCEQLQQWEAAARRVEQDLSDWMRNSLNSAARDICAEVHNAIAKPSQD